MKLTFGEIKELRFERMNKQRQTLGIYGLFEVQMLVIKF